MLDSVGLATYIHIDTHSILVSGFWFLDPIPSFWEEMGNKEKNKTHCGIILEARKAKT
jgi:hypothetical protein